MPFCLFLFFAISIFPLMGQEKSSITESFQNYMSAMINDDGDEAIKYIDSQTIQSYDKTMRQIKYADSAEVVALPFLKKFFILNLRHREPKEKLLAMNGKDLFVYSVEEGSLGNFKNKDTSLGDIELTENKATAGIEINEQKTLISFQFVKEYGTWKIDLTPFNKIGEFPFERSIPKMDDENEYLINLIEQSSGKVAVDSIWHPLKQRN